MWWWFRSSSSNKTNTGKLLSNKNGTMRFMVMRLIMYHCRLCQMVERTFLKTKSFSCIVSVSSSCNWCNWCIHCFVGIFWNLVFGVSCVWCVGSRQLPMFNVALVTRQESRLTDSRIRPALRRDQQPTEKRILGGC